jgi:hypothetical protein
MSVYLGINNTGEQLLPVTTTPGIKCFPGHRRLDSPAFVSLPTPENEKYAKIPSLGVKYTQLRSSQKMEKNVLFYSRCC